MRIKMKQLAAAMFLLTGAASAQAQIYKVVLSGANEIPAATTTGSGSAVITLNTTTHRLRVSANFTGLVGNTTAAHVHCCVAQPANAGVATTTPTFVGFPTGVRAGSWDNTYDMTLAGTWNGAFVTANGGTPAGAEAAFATGVAAGRSYLNIHSASFPGGEIRGLLVRHSFIPAASLRLSSLATALDSLGTGSGTMADRLVAMAFLDNAGQSAAMDALMPVSSSTLQAVTSNNLFTDFDQMGARLQGLRMGADGTDAATTEGAWVKGVSIASEQDADQGVPGFDNDGWDLGLGYDRQLSDEVLVGVAFNITESALDIGTAGSKADIATRLVSVYASREMGNGFVDGMVSYGRHDTDYLRNAGAAGVATGQADSDQVAVRLAGGVTTSIGFTPQARLDWVGLDQDGYTETGASGLALNVGSQSLDRLRASLGGQFDWSLDAGTSPFIRAFWNCDIDDDASTQEANFIGGGSSFTDPGQAIEDSSYTVGVGINFRGENLSGALAYDMSDGDLYDADIFHARLYWAF